ncbi:hypothetical protein DPMN_194094 [Dreissena polymorpha]|uniref:Uncharacterized protein n=1 Tax=Dreissena polymorpha TaxID=45954 RepID=A0A9D4BET3_DREPO|nr:hypothetical protein DPMN_194094 [Dreissena polymorpha]
MMKILSVFCSLLFSNSTYHAEFSIIASVVEIDKAQASVVEIDKVQASVVRIDKAQASVIEIDKA